MTEKTKYQQQILFSEQEIKIPSSSEAPDSQQIVVENNDWQPVELEQDIELSQEHANKPSWIKRTLLVAFSVVISVELFDFFTLGFIESPVMTSLYGIILLCVLLLSSSSLIREFMGLRQLKSRERLRDNIANISEDIAHDEVELLCEDITNNLPCDLSSVELEKWREAKQAEHTNEELLQLYSRIVLTQVDQKALAEVAKFSSESAVLVALSPVALLDMLIMLWRSLTLVDKIAGLYGMKLGYWSRIKLVKQVFTNMLYAGASEVITDVSADMLGADLLGRLSGKLAQGLGAGMLTARLGLKAIYLCRPMPFDESAPRLSQVRKEVIQHIKQLIPTQKKS